MDDWGECVDEVVQFARYGRLLGGRPCDAPRDVVVVERVPEDGREALRNGVALGRGVEGISYDDVVANMSGPIYAKRADHESMRLQEVFLPADQAGLIIVGERLTEEYYPYASWIRDDLYSIAEIRASVGKGNLFWERMYAIYEAGGFPCGWTGEFPVAGEDPAAGLKFLAVFLGLPDVEDRDPPAKSFREWLAEQRKGQSH